MALSTFQVFGNKTKTEFIPHDFPNVKMVREAKRGKSHQEEGSAKKRVGKKGENMGKPSRNTN